MTVVIDGTTGISGVDGTASSPAIEGTDSNTGIFFPAADTIAFAEGGAEVARFDSSGNFGIGTSSPLGGYRLSLTGGGLNVQNTGASDNSIVKYSNSGRNWYAGLRGDTSNAWALSDDSAFRLLVDTSGNLQFNSGYGSVTTAYGCRAWVNFNGTGTVAIRASGNVSSITDNGTGLYAVNLTNAMPDIDYAASGSASTTSGAAIMCCTNSQSGYTSIAPTTTSFRVFTTNNSTPFDSTYVSVQVFR